jgi:hypothetical protein
MALRERVLLNGQSGAVNEAFATDLDYSRLAEIVIGAAQ